MTDKLKEDTVSADRKERIIFDPEAWRKSDKSGRKTSAITSRQNFDNEKFTRNAKPKAEDDEDLKEGTIQPSGDSKIDTAGPEQSDTISKKKELKSNSPQIEFVTGTATPNGSSSTAIGNAQTLGVKKISEAIIKKAITNVKTDKNVGTEEIPFDGPYTKTPDNVVDKSGAKHTPYSRVRDLARQALKKQNQQNEEVEQISELSNTTLQSYKDKAMKSADALAAKGDYKKSNDRLLNHMKASGKQIDRTVSNIKAARLNREEVELEEAYGRKDAYTRDYEHSTAGMGKHQSAAYHADGGANDEGWGNDHKSSYKPRSTMDRPHTVHINGKAWKKFSNGHQAHAAARTLQAKGKDAHAVAHFNEEEETDMSKTYAQFIEQLLEYTPGPGGVTKVQGRSYGANYDAGEGEDDEDAPKAAPKEKRGRGRPAGSKSGANLKVTKGKSYGGIATHSLNLPNSK